MAGTSIELPQIVGLRKGLHKALGGPFVNMYNASRRMDDNSFRSRGKGRTKKDYKKDYRPRQYQGVCTPEYTP